GKAPRFGRAIVFRAPLHRGLAWPSTAGCGCFGGSMLAGAGLDLDGDVAEAADAGEPRLVAGGRLGPVGDQGHDGRTVAGADAPQMQVADTVMRAGFEASRDLAGDPVAGSHVE